MRLLLDTHVLIWLRRDPDRLSKNVRELIEASANDIFVSAATAWEIAIKHRLGKLEFDAEMLDDFDARIRDMGFEPLAITSEHSIAGARLTGAHRDPFDRMLAGQAMAEGLVVVSLDPAIASLGVPTVW